jgi:hypothetical protein
MWYTVYGGGPNLRARGFTVETKRQISDVFLNTHNPTVTAFIGYNNNVSLGNLDVMFYSTLYVTKKNQAEERFPFVQQCNAIAKRMRFIRKREEEALLLVNAYDDNSVVMEADYGRGLGHVLSGILAHFHSSIISATLAWHLVINGSRFRFSHEFASILLSQMEDWLLDRDIQLRYRRNPETRQGWMDSSLFNYLFRPESQDNVEFENMSVWEFTMDYELVLQSKVTRHQKRIQQTCEDVCEEEEEEFGNNYYYDFMDLHPGKKYAKLGKLKRSKIPIIYLRNNMPDLEKCKLNTNANEIGSDTLFARNEYATVMLLLFYPFRYADDIPPFQERWYFFCNKVDNHGLYWDSQRIMQNIQNVHNCKKFSTPADQVHLETVLQHVEKGKNYVNSEGDEDCEDELNQTEKAARERERILMEEVMEEYARLHAGDMGGHNGRRICTNSDIVVNQDYILPRPSFSRDRSVLFDMTTDANGALSGSLQYLTHQRNHENALSSNNVIQVTLDVNRTLATDNISIPWKFKKPNLTYTSTSFDIIGCMDTCIQEYTLDDKQTAAFNIICSSFMMSYLDDPQLKNKPNFEMAKQALLRRGASEQLIMFLSGPGGGGKSHTIKAVKAVCHYFCRCANLQFDPSVFVVTASTNSAAAQLGGHTIHTAAQLRKRGYEPRWF